MRPSFILFSLLAFLLSGCSGGSSELSKKDDQELRHNFSRGLTKEEIARMGGSPKGPAEPVKGK